jgi:hypothetical protein
VKHKAYKIRLRDGGYSKGGSEAGRGPRGKVWVSKQALSSHVTLVTEAWAQRLSDPHSSPHPSPHPYEGAAALDLVAGDEAPVDVQGAIEKLLVRWGSLPHRAKRLATLQAYLLDRVHGAT